VSSVEAARAHFGDVQSLTAVLREYVQRGTFAFALVEAADRVDDRQFAARALSPSEAAAVRGDFHLQRGRLADARASLEEAIHLDPKLAAAHESMGMLAWREGRRQDALTSLSEAISLDATRFLAHYLWGALSSSAEPAEDSGARAESALRKAIELQPAFAPAYAELARMLGAGPERLAEALSQAKKAAQLDPATLHHHLLVVRLLLRMGATDDAEKLARRVLAAAFDPRDREAAQAVLDEIRDARASAGGERVRPPDERAGAGSPALPSPPLAQRVDAPLRAEGRVVQLECGDAEMLLRLDVEGRRVTLHAANFFQLAYLTTTWKAPADFNPCTHLKDRRLRVGYGPPGAAGAEGEIVSIEVLE
jgi:tetratricopeptide (TPR) repeat protein